MTTAILSFLLAPTLALAAGNFHIPTPALGDDLTPVLSGSASAADGFVEGRGATLRVQYRSAVPLHMFLATMISETDYNPGDMYQVTLPVTAGDTALIDLTAMTTWSPGSHKYYISFLSTGGATDAEIQDVQVEGGGGGTTASAAIRHLLEPQPYLVSNMHYLRGRRVLGVSLSVIAGVITLAAAGIVTVRKRKIVPVLATLILCTLIFQLQASWDVGRLAATHAREWVSGHTYGQAGDMYRIADDVTSLARTSDVPVSVTVCFDAFDYEAKLLRYLVTPVPVRVDNTIDETTTHIVTLPTATWGQGSGTGSACDLKNRTATVLHEYPDGAVLSSLSQP